MLAIYLFEMADNDVTNDSHWPNPAEAAAVATLYDIG